MSVMWYDMHSHLDFAKQACRVAQQAAEQHVRFLSVGVTPKNYRDAVSLLHECRNVKVALGAHPWWVEENEHGRDLLRELVSRTPFIGEVGLDLSACRSASADKQRAIFQMLTTWCAQEQGKVLSIHSVKSSESVLDILEKTHCASTCACIFHWFSGSSNDLNRAIRLGCFFSIGQRMMSSKRGRSYAKVIPKDRLLLETDLPSSPDVYITADTFVSSLSTTLSALVAARGGTGGVFRDGHLSTETRSKRIDDSMYKHQREAERLLQETIAQTSISLWDR